MYEAEKYNQYMVLKEKVDSSLNRFEQENKNFNDSISSFMKNKNKWVDYHWSRFKSNTITEKEAIHLADVMETSTELLIAFEENVNKATLFINIMKDYYKEVIKYHENKTPDEVIINLPQLIAYTKEYFSLSEITMAELKKGWADVNILKQKVETIFNKYLN